MHQSTRKTCLRMTRGHRNRHLAHGTNESAHSSCRAHAQRFEEQIQAATRRARMPTNQHSSCTQRLRHAEGTRGNRREPRARAMLGNYRKTFSTTPTLRRPTKTWAPGQFPTSVARVALPYATTLNGLLTNNQTNRLDRDS